MKWHDKNFGIHPDDPAYDRDYDRDADYEEYLYWQELAEEERRCR